ncbi:MAG: isoprenylcysteine carboxylmethyltransferase family protein [Proteobacteria bacterium]|nr:isoprenylcysteine carboxylmethyltransferase family protein [Pseudomonadota bacterium]
MPDALGLAQWIVLAVAVQRALELVLARRNTARLLAAGGIETGAGHYPVIVLLHASWLAVNFLFLPPDAAANGPLLGIFCVFQAGRVWVIASLGAFWTTRIITMPGQPLTMRGPYRFMRHPNYAIVALEIACLPLIFGAWHIAIPFALANLAILAWRIRIEDNTLAPRRGP